MNRRNVVTMVNKFIIVIILVIWTWSAYSLENIVVPDTLQTKQKKPVKRTISLKLPVEQARFHFEFCDKSDLLAGKLVIRIGRENSNEQIVIFEKGKFSEGWDCLSVESLGNVGKDPIYFCFQSTRKFLTGPGDTIEVELAAIQNLTEGLSPWLIEGNVIGEAKSKVLSVFPESHFSCLFF